MLRQVSRLVFNTCLTNVASVRARSFSNTSQLYLAAQKRATTKTAKKTAEKASGRKSLTKSGVRSKKATTKAVVKQPVKKTVKKTAKKTTKKPVSKTVKKPKVTSPRYKPLNGPRKPANAYSLYIKESYPTEKQKSPDAKITEISKKLALQWRGLSEDQKQVYNDKFTQAVETYKQENIKWLESLTPLDYLRENMYRKAQGKKLLKDPNRPKRPIGTYMTYAIEMMKSSDLANVRPVTERASLIAKRWNNLSKEEKQPYEEAAGRDAKRYEAEKGAYMKQLQKFKDSEPPLAAKA